MQPPALVTDQNALDELCEVWRAHGWFAFDTEFIRDDTYDALLCLIQVADSDGQITLIDPTASVDLTGFWDLVTDPAVRTVIHAGKEDFEVCLRLTGQVPRNVFDVQIACGFAGFGFPLSLGRMVDQVLRKRITKGQTLTDWERRPLTDEQLRYAVEDVIYLPKLYGKLMRKLEAQGRVAWAEEENARYEDPELYRPPTEDRLFRLKGSKRLDGLGLAVLQRVIEWREQWAQTHNRPVRAMMRDDVVVEIARRRPTRASDFHVMRGFPQARNTRVVRELVELVKEAKKIPRAEWPKPFQPRDDSPMNKALLDILSAVLRAICFEEEVSADLVGSTHRLRELLDYQAGKLDNTPALLTGWRREFIGQRLMGLLEGRSELHLTGCPDDPHLEVITQPDDHGEAD